MPKHYKIITPADTGWIFKDVGLKNADIRFAGRICFAIRTVLRELREYIADNGTKEDIQGELEAEFCLKKVFNSLNFKLLAAYSSLPFGNVRNALIGTCNADECVMSLLHVVNILRVMFVLQTNKTGFICDKENRDFMKALNVCVNYLVGCRSEILSEIPEESRENFRWDEVYNYDIAWKSV